jgi:hypothetical protein
MKVTLWTIQDEKAWQELNRKGVFIPKEKFVPSDFKKGYDWLKNQMIQRIGKPKYNKQYPIWAWFHHQDEKNKKPDLRKSGHLPTGTNGYRIEIQKDINDILLSDFELWHYVINDWYLASSRKDDKSFNKDVKNKSPQYIKSKKERSWEKVFDMDFKLSDYALPFQKKSIQATFWSLKLHEVIKVDKFVAR